MSHALRALERQLGDKDTLLDRLTYADLSVVEALAFVRPHARHPLRRAIVRPLDFQLVPDRTHAVHPP